MQHLASNVSHHNAMTYDTHPHEWSFQMWKPYKKPLVKKTIRHYDLGGHKRCKASITIKKHKMLWEYKNED